MHSLLIGLVGKPNSGKTTLFNALTSDNAKTANYPFTTIEPNVGIGYATQNCPCNDFNVEDDPRNSLCKQGTRYIPIKVIDVAGLVPDAWKGRGLGNEFLDDLSQADALIHVVDASGRYDAEGEDLGEPGAWDPLKDIQFLEHEISRWIQQIILREWESIKRKVKNTRQDITPLLKKRLSGLSISKQTIKHVVTTSHLSQKKPENWTKTDILHLAKQIRQKAKPILIMANKIDIPQAEKNYKRIQNHANDPVIPCSALAELALTQGVENNTIQYTRGSNSFTIRDQNALTKRKQNLYEKIRDLLDKWGSTGVQQVINTTVFQILDLITVYPVRNIEKLTDKEGRVIPDVHLVPRGTTAEEFASKVHSEIQEHFLYAVDARKKRKISSDDKLKNKDVISIKTSSRR